MDVKSIRVEFSQRIQADLEIAELNNISGITRKKCTFYSLLVLFSE